MLPASEERLNRLVKASEAVGNPYVVVEYQGKRLLMLKSELKFLVHRTWGRVNDPETAELAKELGLKLRKIRGIVLQ